MELHVLHKLIWAQIIKNSCCQHYSFNTLNRYNFVNSREAKQIKIKYLKSNSQRQKIEKMNTGGHEWYWNLNLHRNQPILSNLSAVNNTTLPLSAALYTSAVLTDRGICVGMRNVNLKGVNQAPSSESHIPNCSNGTNVVGERNGQTWRAAFERMRYSALTDPTMATTQIEHPHCGPQFPQNVTDNDIDYVMDNSCDTEQCPPPSSSSNSIAAELNPFHLFGDKSTLSTINFSNNSQCHQELAHIWNQSADFVTASNAYRTQAGLLPSSPSIHQPYHNYHYLTDSDERLNGGVYRYGHRNILGAKSISSRSNSPTSYAPTNPLKATSATLLSQRLDNSVSRLNHVVAPKKKWIRNYMQSNSHLWFFLLSFCLFLDLFVSTFFYSSSLFFLCFSVIFVDFFRFHPHSSILCFFYMFHYFSFTFVKTQEFLFAISYVMKIALHWDIVLLELLLEKLKKNDWKEVAMDNIKIDEKQQISISSHKRNKMEPWQSIFIAFERMFNG